MENNQKQLNANETVGDCCNENKSSHEAKRMLINRLSRIIGQINGIKGMVEKDEYTVDILIQASAATAALNSFSRELFQKYVSEEVCGRLKNDDSDVINEFLTLLKKMMS